MTETRDPSGDRSPPLHSARRRRRHRRRPLLLRFWWIIPLAGLLAIIAWFWGFLANPHWHTEPLAGYIADTHRIADECQEYTGKPLDNDQALRQIEEANRLVLIGNYTNAAILLEQTAKQIAVPAIFNNLGVLYMKLKDGPHAMRAFRDALARDHDYEPARANLKLWDLGVIDPATREVEPNNTDADANPIWIDRPVEGEISSGIGDIDCYWFTTPRPPRDRISITVVNHSPTLIPRLRVHDRGGKILSGIPEAAGPGSSLRLDFSAPPDTFYTVRVEGSAGTAGEYTLTVGSLHAYDVYEPNDSFGEATHIALDQPIEANILDADDTDFYAFTSPGAKTVAIDVHSRSNTLIPGLSTFGLDLHNIGMGPDVTAPGGSIHYTMPVEANQIYYVQVFSKSSTSGEYTLTVH